MENYQFTLVVDSVQHCSANWNKHVNNLVTLE